MGAWGNGNFENDRALDHVYRLLHTIADRVEKAVAKLPRQRSPDFDTLLADLELLGVIARHVYQPSCFTFIVRGYLLPDQMTIREWKAVVLRAWDRDWKDDSEEGRACRRVIAATFDNLARTSRRQMLGAMRTFDAYLKELHGVGIDPKEIEKYEQRMLQMERELKEQARHGESAKGV